MKPETRTIFICVVAAVFVCALFPIESAGDYRIVYGKAYAWNSYKQMYIPVNGLTVTLECSTGTYYETTHYDPYHGSGFYEFMASDVGRPEWGTVSITYEGCTYYRSFTEDDIPARRDFYLDAC
jgi:hypothetical protein